MDYYSIVLGVGTALVYSLLWFAGNKVTSGADFDPYQLFSTLAIGAIWGAILTYTGAVPTMNEVGLFFAANFTLVVMTEKVIKILLGQNIVSTIRLRGNPS
jgi:hypothetical protein